LQRTLLLAQKFVDQTKRESEAEAAAVVAQAEETARAAIAAAEATSAQLQAETHQKLRDEVSRLEATRTELATDVESMARHLESERNRLRGALSEILKWVDENVQPANSLMGVKPKAAPSAAPHDQDAQQRLPEAGRRACCPCPSHSGIVTRSPAEVLRGIRPPDVVRRRER
jgi:hypothetical protein